MKAKLVRNVKKLAAVATGALFVGATLGMASVFASGLSSLPGPFVSNGHVNAVFVVGATAQPTDVLGAIDVSAALTAAAAATHSSTVSGQITIGTLALKSKSSQTLQPTANDTLFSSFSPASSIVDISNATYTLASGTKMNASWQESFSFSTTSGQMPFVNGLNVEFPSKSFSIISTLHNRNESDVVMPLMNNTEYLIGSKPLDLISLTANNASFGVLYNASNVPIGTASASSIVAGPYTVDLTGISKVLTATGTTNMIDFNVNGGKTQYANLSTSVSLDSGKLVITFGKDILENSTGDYLSSIDISSISLVQNNSAANVFGLGPYNVSWNKPTSLATGFLFTYTGKQTLNYSFSKAMSFPIMANLSTISLEPLVPASFKVNGGFNVSVATGPGKADFLNSTEQTNTSKSPVVTLDYSHGLTNLGFGTDFRGNLTTSGYGGPDLLLEHFQRVFNVSSGQYITAPSEYIFPRINYSNPTYYNDKTNGTAIIFNTVGPKGTVRVVYELPNGRDLALQYNTLNIFKVSSTANATSQNATIGSISLIYNYTAATTGNPAIIAPVAGKTYSFDGYNLTLLNNSVENITKVYNVTTASASYVTKKAVTVLDAKISGPEATAGGLSVIPGYSGLYASNGTSLQSVGVDNGYLGTLKFNGSELVYTDPLGETQMIGITENKSTFATNISVSTKNTTANTWGDFVNGVKKGDANIAIPVQNYTVALAGAQTIIGQQNYTIGQTVSSGKLLGVSGVSTINAGSLINGNPDIAELDTTFNGATNSVPVIVMGGPAVNTLAGDLLNMTASTPLSQFINETGVHPNEAMIEMFNNVSEFKNQPALLVAGYYGNNTLEAAEVLSESLIGQPVVSLTGNKVILSTASSSYTGVTIVS
jgi:hypothetical protein